MNLKDYLRSGNGASDITPLLANKDAFGTVVDSLSSLFNDKKIDVVACVEGRGFILGGAVAYRLKCGLIPLRYPGKLKNEVYSQTYTDYSGKEKELQIHKDSLTPNQTILLIDDWLETGATVKTAVTLLEKCGGKIEGIGVFMDASSDKTKQELIKYSYRYIEKVEKGDNF